MDKITKNNKVYVIIFVAIIIIAIILGIALNKKPIIIPSESPIVKEEVENIDLCYYRADKTASDLYDTLLIKIKIEENNVTGEFQNFPAETDGRFGKFEGTVSSLDLNTMGRKATVFWDSLEEGIVVKEELLIELREGSAVVAFGEMVDRGDGVLEYKDKTNLSYRKPISQIDCSLLGEKIFVEKYIEDHISTIAPNKPVLGGTWYVVSVTVNPDTHTGSAIYEDGHIQSTALFTYEYSKNPESVKIMKITVK